MTQVETRYRNDIDGLRAIAVLAVILFHFGILPSGYLGVDVFFVISGYLITGIIARELSANRFSIVQFYMRRTRRILPLASVVAATALVIGLLTMLPDDLENLAQSVVASNFFANNVLQAITTKNYWDVVNEYKPLMHTWSLGIEEQYYLVYAPLLAIVGTRRRTWLLPALTGLAAISLVLVLLPFADHAKFYLLHFRFFELAAGGIAALLSLRSPWRNPVPALTLTLLSLVLWFQLPDVPGVVAILATVLLTVLLLAAPAKNSRIVRAALENRVMRWTGLISFSLYMWHQVLLAFARYFIFEELGAQQLAIILLTTVGLSLLTYHVVEKPFRDRSRIQTWQLFAFLGVLYGATTGVSLYLYATGGVVRDVPELDLVAGKAERGVHSQFNHAVYDLDRDFESTGRVKVLVIGNSFARDWVNVLAASPQGKDLDISYIYAPEKHPELHARAAAADVIFISTPTRDQVLALGLGLEKVYAVGTKSFGKSNGIFYNHHGPGYFTQRTHPEKGFLEENALARREWGDHYLDYFEKVVDEEDQVPVFTPDQKFISQDCRHLTRGGARYFSKLFEPELTAIILSARR